MNLRSEPRIAKMHQARGTKWLRAVILYSVLAVLLYFALRNAPFAEIWSTLTRLEAWQVGIILLTNVLVIACMTARWWIIVRAENPSVPFLSMIGYRLSAFGISYFTPGPQVGGEPLQVVYLQRNHEVSLARAASAVIMDKLLEFLANFALLGAGAWAILRLGMISSDGNRLTVSLIGLGVLLILPIVQIILLYFGFHPITKILLSLPFIAEEQKAVRTVIVAERMASAFSRRHFYSMVLSGFFSFLAVAGIGIEYFLMAEFLGMSISVIQILVALTAMQLAFLMPLPGGLGALEASQVFALGAFGHAPSLAISLTLLMRARDVLNGTLGLILAGRGVTK